MMRAECSRLMIAAARLPARRLPANSQFALPSAMGLLVFSTPLFELGPVPSLPRSDLEGFTGVYVDMLRPLMDEYRPGVLPAAPNWWNGLAAPRAAAGAGIPRT